MEGSGFTATEAWTIAGVGFGAAVLGALIGGLTTLTLEVWRRVLDAVSAARLIRMELVTNRDFIGLALKNRTGAMNLSDEGWRAHRVSLAPILDEIALGKLWRDYGFIGQARLFIQLIHDGTQREQETAKNQLQEWHDVLAEHGKSLRVLEGRSKIRHMWTLLRGGHLATEEELKAAFSRRTAEVEDGNKDEVEAA